MKNPEKHELKKSAASLADHGRSLRSGVYEFIPLPFIDDYLLKRERRKLVESVLKRNNVGYDEKAAATLAGRKGSLSAKLRGFARGLLMKPLKKVFRTVFFWLMVKNAVSDMIESYLLARFAGHPRLALNGYLTEERAQEVMPIFERNVTRIDHRLAGEGVRHLWQWMRKQKQEDAVSGENVEEAIEKEAPGLLASFDRKVDEELGSLPA
ncbi:MAG: hypothetical protein Q7Q71_10000 [Verrucomicrobiota bacterium JB023]|nr:hypothetical protein [Verrucomicrobiota bacterium JB023]